MKRIVVKVYGGVQGVFFRAYTKGKADALGLTGWVKNEDDGSVVIVAEGEEKKLKDLLKWLEGGGPKFAKVERLKVQWQEGSGEFKNFDIRF